MPDRRRVGLLALALAATIVGCGNVQRTATTTPAVLPAPAPVAPVMAVTIADGANEEGTDPSTDLRSGDVEQRDGGLQVRISLAGPVDAVAGRTDIGAYLLASEDDTEPFAAHVILEPGAAPVFRFAPWLEEGVAVTGRVEGDTVEIDVPDIAEGRFRYVQLYSESDAGGDVAPDPDAGGNDLVPLT